MHTINLTNYIVHLYVNPLFNIEVLSDSSLINELNSQEYPRGIVERLEAIGNLTKVQIYDQSNNLILSSEYAIE